MKYDFYNQVLTPVLESISKYPQRNAFCIDESFYTYEMFSERIGDISEGLRNSTFCKRQVGLVINDDLDTYASIFSLWLKGLCYVPLHPGWRLRFRPSSP